jgi:pimeloyl-ACP methyl ester carboxylesterase
MAFLQTEHGELFYEAHGEGEPALVCVHGLGCAHEDWQAQVESLRSRHRVVTLDLCGHGLSSGFSVGFDIETCGADLVALMSTLDLPSAVLMGHSMGCRVVLEVARVAPERVAGLVLMDGSRLAASTWEVAADVARRTIAGAGYEKFMTHLFESMFNESSDPALRSRIVERALGVPERVGAEMFVQMCAWDSAYTDATLAGLKVPLLVLQSTYLNEDTVRMSLERGMSTPWLDLVRELVPGARIEIVEGVGHFTMIEAADVVNAHLSSFLQDI